MGVSGGNDRLCVAVGEGLGESLADKALEDGAVDGGHLGKTRRVGKLWRTGGRQLAIMSINAGSEW